MNYCWAWVANCDVDWAGWVGAFMSAAAILASVSLALFIQTRDQRASRTDARDAANTAMEEAAKRLTMVAYVARQPGVQFGRHDDDKAPLRIADETLSMAIMGKLGSGPARAQMISMREHIRAVAAHFGEAGEEHTKIVVSVVGAAWRSLHAFQAALRLPLSSRDEVEKEILAELVEVGNE